MEEAPRSDHGLLGDELQAVLSVLPQSWMLVDPLGAVLQKSDADGDYGIEVLDQVQDQQILDLVALCNQQAAPLTGEVTLARTRTHPQQTIGLRMVPLRGSYVLLLVEDLTDVNRLADMRRDFVANISHELKTPVGALSLLAEAIDMAGDDAEALRGFASRIKREADRLAVLVGDLIDLSRVQDDAPSTHVVDIDVDWLVTGALDDVKTLAAAKQIEMVVGGTGQLRVPGRPEQLASALRNLLSNAIHYSHPATRVAVGTRAQDGMLEISVVDQGIGIPKSDQERIFERFYRVDPARSRQTGGTGLGLAIVKHVCASHGGDCTVWSNPGDGSTFTMRLPLGNLGAADSED